MVWWCRAAWGTAPLGPKKGDQSMVKNSLCAALEALEEFQGKHKDWRWVRKETESLIAQLEGVLSGLESLVKDMKREEAEKKVKEGSFK